MLMLPPAIGGRTIGGPARTRAELINDGAAGPTKLCIGDPNGDWSASGMPSRFISIPLTAQFGLPSPVVSNPIVAVGTVGKGILRFTTIGSRVVTLLITGGPIDGTRAGPSTAEGPIIGGAIGYLGDCIASGIPSRFMSTPVTAQFGLPSPVVSMVIVAVGSIGGL